jgi:predicted RNA-binding protein with PUA-like domain
MSKEKRYWLMKSEPEECSIADLERAGRTLWTGVRNYQARNFMVKEMTIGDAILFYHSNSNPSGVAGVAEVCGKAKPDPLQFDNKSDYFDPKATLENPIWHCVEVKFVERFPELISLPQLRSNRKLKTMLLLRPGQRLSIQPATELEFNEVKHMAKP